MGIIAAIRAGLEVILGIFGFINRQADKVKEVETKNVGKNEVAVETIKVVEEERKDNAELREDIAGRTDADLRDGANKWVRD